MRGVTFILGPVENGPPRDVENPIKAAFLLHCGIEWEHARVLIHWTPRGAGSSRGGFADFLPRALCLAGEDSSQTAGPTRATQYAGGWV